jgi:hypothetical protein
MTFPPHAPLPNLSFKLVTRVCYEQRACAANVIYVKFDVVQHGGGASPFVEYSYGVLVSRGKLGIQRYMRCTQAGNHSNNFRPRGMELPQCLSQVGALPWQFFQR